MAVIEAICSVVSAFIIGALQGVAVYEYAIWRVKRKGSHVGDFVMGGLADGLLWVWATTWRWAGEDDISNHLRSLRVQLVEKLET